MIAYEFLKNKGWCQDAFAKNVFGENTHMGSKEACSFCATAAVVKSYGLHSDTAMLKLYKALCGTSEHPSYLQTVDRVAYWNDESGRTKDEVLKLFEEAGV
jgi:hypothetical protein